MPKAFVSRTQALQMLAEGTGMQWKEISRHDVWRYSNFHRTYVFVLCLNDSCDAPVYVVPKFIHPTLDELQRVIHFLKQNAMGILPKIKLDADKVLVDSSVLAFGVRFYVRVLLDTDLILKQRGSKNPITYSPGKLYSIKFSSPKKLDKYLKSWTKVSIDKLKKNEIIFNISNAVSGESHSFDATLGSDGSISVNFTPDPVDTSIGDNWQLENQLTLAVKIQNHPFPPPPLSLKERNAAAKSSSVLSGLGWLRFIIIGAEDTIGRIPALLFSASNAY